MPGSRISGNVNRDPELASLIFDKLQTRARERAERVGSDGIGDVIVAAMNGLMHIAEIDFAGGNGCPAVIFQIGGGQLHFAREIFVGPNGERERNALIARRRQAGIATERGFFAALEVGASVNVISSSKRGKLTK